MKRQRLTQGRETLTLHLPKELKEKIQKLADEDCRTVSNWITVFLTKNLKEEKQK